MSAPNHEAREEERWQENRDRSSTFHSYIARRNLMTRQNPTSHAIARLIAAALIITATAVAAAGLTAPASASEGVTAREARRRRLDVLPGALGAPQDRLLQPWPRASDPEQPRSPAVLQLPRLRSDHRGVHRQGAPRPRGSLSRAAVCPRRRPVSLPGAHRLLRVRPSKERLSQGDGHGAPPARRRRPSFAQTRPRNGRLQGSTRDRNSALAEFRSCAEN